MQSRETKKLEASGAMFSRIVLQTVQPLTILDWRDDSGLTDRLFLQSDRSKGCTRNRCTGSKVGTLLALQFCTLLSLQLINADLL